MVETQDAVPKNSASCALPHAPTPSHHSKQTRLYFNIAPILGLDFTGISILQQEMSFVSYGTRLTKLIIREYKINLLAEFNQLANLPESWISL